MSGRALTSCDVVDCTSLNDGNSRPLCSKNGPPAGCVTATNSLGSFCSAILSALAAASAKFRRTRFDDDEYRLPSLREGVVDGVIERGPFLVVFDEAADVRIDLEVMGDVIAACDRKRQRNADDLQRTAHGKDGEANNG